MSYQAASSHKTFPPPLSLGSSIAAVGTDRSGSLGAYFRVADPEKTSETTVILTSRRAVANKEQHRETNIAIQSPSRKEIEALLTGEQRRLDFVNEQAEGDLKTRDKKLTRVEGIINKIQCIRVALDCAQNVTIGHVLHSSAPECKGTSGSKMDWALVESTSNRTLTDV